MSLYHEAAEVLDNARKGGGSLKSIVFGRKNWKSDVKTLFALSAETAKWSGVLSEVLENSGLLQSEKQLTPLLALVLAHDLLVSKRGIALPSKHGINAAISRHKARLSAELTKARLRRGFATIDALRLSVNDTGRGNGTESTLGRYPRWIRINTIRSTLDEQLGSTFSNYDRVTDLTSICSGATDQKLLFVDQHVPNLIAVPSQTDITSTTSYKEGKLILQDKASCFPALLLDPASQGGDLLDACAAPGNKTTHLASLRAHAANNTDHNDTIYSIFACEKDSIRTQILSKMVKLAGAEGKVRILRKQDFLRLNPQDEKFRDVGALLLDPSCSGSGIVGRDEATVEIRLPNAHPEPPPRKGKKRKRGVEPPTSSAQSIAIALSEAEHGAEQEEAVIDADQDRLQARLTALSAFQLRIIEHAMSFPAATKITYSTCSVHDDENEQVVVKALLSQIAKERGWRILERDQQVDGMRRWARRGKLEAVEHAYAQYESAGHKKSNSKERLIADACIRCQKGTEERTMGFFLAGFIRDTDDLNVTHDHVDGSREDTSDHESEEWSGFSES